MSKRQFYSPEEIRFKKAESARIDLENHIRQRNGLEKQYGVEYNKSTNPWMYDENHKVFKEYNKYFAKKNKETYK